MIGHVAPSFLPALRLLSSSPHCSHLRPPRQHLPRMRRRRSRRLPNHRQSPPFPPILETIQNHHPPPIHHPRRPPPRPLMPVPSSRASRDLSCFCRARPSEAGRSPPRAQIPLLYLCLGLGFLFSLLRFLRSRLSPPCSPPNTAAKSTRSHLPAFLPSCCCHHPLL